MKKLLFGAVALFLMTGCSGNGTSEKTRKYSLRIADSIEQVEASRQAEEAVQEAAERARQDSIRRNSVRQDSIAKAQSPQANLADAEITKIVKQLWKGLPDHGMNGYTKSCLTPEFYTLADVGYAVPTDAPGGIGSEDFVWYWYNEQDWDVTKSKVISVSPISKNPDKIIAKVKYTDGWSPSTHKIVLVKLPGYDKWLIDDFNGKKQSLYRYISDIGVKFMNGYAKEILADPEIGGWMDTTEKQEYLNEVERFKKKFKAAYPNGIGR